MCDEFLAVVAMVCAWSALIILLAGERGWCSQRHPEVLTLAISLTMLLSSAGILKGAILRACEHHVAKPSVRSKRVRFRTWAAVWKWLAKRLGPCDEELGRLLLIPPEHVNQVD